MHCHETAEARITSTPFSLKCLIFAWQILRRNLKRLLERDVVVYKLRHDFALIYLGNGINHIVTLNTATLRLPLVSGYKLIYFRI